MDRERMREIASRVFEHHLRNGSFHTGRTREDFDDFINLSAVHWHKITGVPISEAVDILRAIFSFQEEGVIIIQYVVPDDRRQSLGELIIRSCEKIASWRLSKSRDVVQKLMILTVIIGKFEDDLKKIGISGTEAAIFVRNLAIEDT